eukprot:6911019-Ditylum_brightwellii.AAC.1
MSGRKSDRARLSGTPPLLHDIPSRIERQELRKENQTWRAHVVMQTEQGQGHPKSPENQGDCGKDLQTSGENNDGKNQLGSEVEEQEKPTRTGDGRAS